MDVLLVDDEPKNLMALTALLEDLGARIHCVNSGEDALRQVLKRQFAAILLDVRMPGIDGLELQRRLADSDPPIPIVFIAARASDEEESRALRAGAVAFLRKPVDKETLLRVLGVVLERSDRDRGRADDD